MNRKKIDKWVEILRLFLIILILCSLSPPPLSNKKKQTTWWGTIEQFLSKIIKPYLKLLFLNWPIREEIMMHSTYKKQTIPKNVLNEHKTDQPEKRLQLNNLQRFCLFWCRDALVHPVPTVSVCGADRESFGKSPDFHSCIFQRQLQILLWEKNIIHQCEIVSTL